MKNIFTIAISTILSLFFTAYAYTVTPQTLAGGSDETQQVLLIARGVVIPAGTTIHARYEGGEAVLIENLIVGDAVIPAGFRFPEEAELSSAPQAGDATVIAGSVLMGAILGHDANILRSEVGALMGGLSGLASVADDPNAAVLALDEDLTVNL